MFLVPTFEQCQYLVFVEYLNSTIQTCWWQP